MWLALLMKALFLSIDGNIADLIVRSREHLADYPVSMDTHDLHIHEASDEVAITYKPKDSRGLVGRGNLSSEAAVTIVFDKETKRVKQIYYVR